MAFERMCLICWSERTVECYCYISWLTISENVSDNIWMSMFYVWIDIAGEWHLNTMPSFVHDCESSIYENNIFSSHDMNKYNGLAFCLCWTDSTPNCTNKSQSEVFWLSLSPFQMTDGNNENALLFKVIGKLDQMLSFLVCHSTLMPLHTHI